MYASTVTTRWCGSMASKQTAREERRLAGVVVAGDDEVLAGAEGRDDELAGRRREHPEPDELVHRHGQVAVPADRQERLGGDAVAGIAAEHGEQTGSIGQLQVELRVAGVELDLVGAELAGGPADQVDQLVLVGSDGCPAHSFPTDEGYEHLVRPVDVDVLDVGVAPEAVQLAEPVDVGHHGVEHSLVGVVRQWRQSAPDPRLVVPGELAVDLGDGGDLLGVRGHPRPGGEGFLNLARARACRRCRRGRARVGAARRRAARRMSDRAVGGEGPASSRRLHPQLLGPVAATVGCFDHPSTEFGGRPGQWAA